MQTKIVSMDDPQVISIAAETLQSGELIVFPTDTVYGLAARLADEPIQKIYEVKGREHTKAIAVLIGNMDQLTMVTDFLPENARKLAEKFWPGALTLVVQKSKGIPATLSPDQTIGIRMPDHTFTRALLSEVGPLATTSANLSSQPSATNAVEAKAQLNNRVALIIDGGESPGGIASTVLDCTSNEIKVLRSGAISTEQLKSVKGVKLNI